MPGENRLPAIIARLQAEVDAVVLAAAERIVESAKERVPVETGDLREAIHIDEQAEGVYVVAGNNKVFYGHLVEHGTTHSAPRPFLVPALEENSESIVRAVELAIREATG